MAHNYFTFYFDDASNDTQTDIETDTLSDTQTLNDNNSTSTTDKKYSDDDLDRIIGERFRRWQTQQQKAIDEAKRLAAMSAQERAEAERDALQKELDDLKRAKARSEMEHIARKMLSDDGVNVQDDVISILVRDNADDTRNAVKSFAASYKEAVQFGIASSLAHKAPSGATSTGMTTKDEIMKIKDPIKRQKAIKDNMKLFR